MLDRIGAFLGRTGESSHAYDVSTETFVQPRLDRLATDLHLERDGLSRGADEEPSNERTEFDLVETRIVDRIERERANADNQFRDMMNTYRDRIFDLEFDTKVSQIRSAADIGVAAIEGEAAKGVDRLNPLRRDMLEAERHLTTFRQKHGIDRPADYPRTSGQRWFLYGVLFVVLIVEMLLNGVFFAEGSPLGLVGGWFQAAIFAALNIGIGWGRPGRHDARLASVRRTADRRLGGTGILCRGGDVPQSHGRSLPLGVLGRSGTSRGRRDANHPGRCLLRTRCGVADDVRAGWRLLDHRPRRWASYGRPLLRL
ncbi:hypothetical protein GCM10020258_27160 [Sphingomonas yabuuchiae]